MVNRVPVRWTRGQYDHCSTGSDDQRVFDQAAAGLADFGNRLLAAGQRQVRQRHGRGHSNRCTRALAPLWRQRCAGDGCTGHPRQQAQEHRTVGGALHLVTEQLPYAHCQRAVFEQRLVEQGQVAGGVAVGKACCSERGHRRHRTGAGDGADQGGRKQAGIGHLGILVR
jgi:hypothetical protein